MKLLDRYILKEWATVFALTSMVVVGLLVLQNMYDSLSDLLDAEASAAEIAKYYSLTIPAYLPAILPIAFLVSILFALGVLHRNNEVVAMRAAGMSLFRISRVLWGAALVLSAALLYLSSSVVPWSVEASQRVYETLQYQAAERERGAREMGVVHNLGFDNRESGRLWFMNRFSERAWLGMGVSVHVRDDKGREVRRISSREAYYDDTENRWVFVQGRDMKIDPATGDPLRALPFEKKVFESFEVSPDIMLALHRDPEDLSLFELQRLLDAVPPEENPAARPYEVRFHKLLATPFSCLVVVCLAVPFAVAGVRVNPMVGIAKSIGWFFLFYVLVSVTTVLGDRELVPPLAAAWGPVLLMLAVGAALFRKHR